MPRMKPILLMITAIAISAAIFSATSLAGLKNWKDRGGAELWAANCRHCHTLRSPASYNNDEWECAITHMRFRCGLTANEARKIVEFLKSAR